MFRKCLIFVAIATMCIFSLADGQKDPCSTTGCGNCNPVVTQSTCNTEKKMYVDRSKICSCCPKCIDYLKVNEGCVAVFAYFSTKRGGTISVEKQCAPGLFCGARVCEIKKKMS